MIQWDFKKPDPEGLWAELGWGNSWGPPSLCLHTSIWERGGACGREACSQAPRTFSSSCFCRINPFRAGLPSQCYYRVDNPAPFTWRSPHPCLNVPFL